MNARSNLAAALLVGLIVGVWAGSVLDRRAMGKMRRQGPNIEKMVKRLTRDLKLDDSQAAAVRAALESRKARHEQLRAEHEGRMKALRAEIDADIEKVLTPEQKTRFAEKRAEWEKKRGLPPR